MYEYGYISYIIMYVLLYNYAHDWSRVHFFLLLLLTERIFQ